MVKTRPTVVIVGLGLVGGSLARVLTRAGWRVVGVDRPSVLRRAKRARTILRSATRLDAALPGADIVVLAAPPRANLGLLRRLARSGTAAVITDVGSVKGPICAEARRLGLGRFVGSHPMAGTEGSGFRASTEGLFRGRTWVLTPAPPSISRVVRAMVRAAGARAVVMSASAHDRSVAFLSHAPQIASWAILAGVLDDPVARKHRRIAGPGFHDMTRLARSPRRLWREILSENRTEVVRALRGLLRGLSRSAGALRADR